MKINEIIKARRLAKNYTQEQVADYLGVSTPAVNKWEKGTTYPDITLLPALARLLDTDLNTLLSFQDDLSDKEIALFLNTLAERSKQERIEEIFQAARDKIKQFPTSDALILNTALFLKGLLAMDSDREHQENLQNEVQDLFLRAMQSPESRIRNSAKSILISKHMAEKDFEQAQELLDSLPDHDFINKKQLQINLLMASDRLDEAARTAEEKLLSTLNDVHPLLMSLIEIAVKQNRMEDAQYIADVFQKESVLFDLNTCNSYIAHFQLYTLSHQYKQALKVLIPMLKSLSKPWLIHESPLYRHIQTKEIDKDFSSQMQKAIIKSLFNDEENAYFKNSKELKSLMQTLKIDLNGAE